MDVPTNADINCLDGYCGHLTYLVLAPPGREVTHLVVKDGFLGDEHLVPIDMIIECKATEVWLCCVKSEFKQMPLYGRNKDLQPVKSARQDGVGQECPIRVRREQIPGKEIALKRGVAVRALDGQVGQVSKVLIVPTDRTITYLVAEGGHFWEKHQVSIPVSEIERIDKDAVYLRITKDIVEALQTV